MEAVWLLGLTVVSELWGMSISSEPALGALFGFELRPSSNLVLLVTEKQTTVSRSIH